MASVMAPAHCEAEDLFVMLASLVWPWGGRVGCWGVVGCLQVGLSHPKPSLPKMALKIRVYTRRTHIYGFRTRTAPPKPAYDPTLALGLPDPPCLNDLPTKKHCHQQHDDASNKTQNSSKKRQWHWAYLLLLASMDQAMVGLDVKVGGGLPRIKNHWQQRVGVGEGDQLVCPAIRGHVPKV
eukprot:1156737-Pelagomonas_calceolata.AAC.1